MSPDQLRTPTATKNLLRPLELMVTERSLKRAGGVVPLGGGALDISLALIQAALNLAYRLIFHQRGRMSLPFSELASAAPIEGGVRQSNSAKLLSAGETIEVDEAKKAEDRLRRNETWLAQAQRLSHTGTWVLDGTTMRFLYWSDESYRIWGFDPLQGLPSRDDMWERIHPDDRERVWGEVQEALREKRDFLAEFKILLPDETVKYLEANTHHEFSPLGALLEVICTNVDVTERKYAEQALRESERKHRQLIESIPCHFWSATPNGEPTYVNQRLLDYFGPRFEDERKGDGTEKFLHPDDVAETERALSHAFRTGESFQRVHRLRRADGKYRWHRVRAEPQRDPSGNIIQWYGFSVDIDEVKKAEDVLRESEQSLRSAIDGIAGLIAILAANGELETVNRQITEYFGWPAEELKNWETSDAVHPEDLPRVLELYTRSIAGGNPFQFELRLRRFDGEYRWFENRGVPIRDNSGHILRWYILLVDVEDRTRALERLQQMQSDLAHMNRVSMMGELAASLCHEILHPIATARNNARAGMRFLEMSPPNLDEARESLGCVVRDADRAKDIAGRIRNQIKKVPSRKERFDLNEAINEVIVMVRSAIAKNGASVSARLMDGQVPVRGDRVQLQQVLVNLILNAVEAMSSIEDRPRELSLRTEQSHTGGILVAVGDSGPGIDSVNLERVFEPFYTTKNTGVGMGLSICQTIINGHGGKLWAEANEPCGAVFQFTLPGAQEDS
jgi:PAS domain S-box-containing protein